MWMRLTVVAVAVLALTACGEEDEDEGEETRADAGATGGSNGSGGEPGAGGACGGDVDLTDPAVETAAEAARAACRGLCAAFEMCDVWPAEGQTRAECEASCEPDADERTTWTQAYSAPLLAQALTADGALSGCLADLSCDDLAGWVNAELDVDTCAGQVDAVSAAQQAAWPCESP